MSKSQGHLYKTTVEVIHNGKKVRLTKKDAALLKAKQAEAKKAKSTTK